jgi:hypothetical protein
MESTKRKIRFRIERLEERIAPSKFCGCGGSNKGGSHKSGSHKGGSNQGGSRPIGKSHCG